MNWLVSLVYLLLLLRNGMLHLLLLDYFFLLLWSVMLHLVIFQSLCLCQLLVSLDSQLLVSVTVL